MIWIIKATLEAWAAWYLWEHHDERWYALAFVVFAVLTLLHGRHDIRHAWQYDSCTGCGLRNIRRVGSGLFGRRRPHAYCHLCMPELWR
jgi:hypothetical protein